MDGESRVMLYAGITALAAVVGTFVLWGPSAGTRPKRKGAVIGLQNLGLTCYLNSLLQAMASCYYFVDWLNFQENQQGDVTTTMRKLINILCGKTTPLPEEEYFISPVEVINALHHSGWKITNSQQDVHELLCNLVSILEEEAYKSCVDLSLSVEAVTQSIRRNTEVLKSCNMKRISLDSDSGHDHSLACSSTNGSIYEGIYDFDIESDTLSQNVDASHVDLNCTSAVRSSDGDIAHGRGDGLANHPNHNINIENKFENRLDRVKNLKRGRSLDAGPPDLAVIRARMKTFRTPRIAHDLNQSPRPSPFRGYLTNKIECTKCSYKSVLRYDKFDSISLHLPEPSNQNIHTLSQLLNNFVKNELIGGITCEGCNKNRAPNTDLITSPAVKLSRFGKLPACLCIHIVRTSFYEYGVYKRQDYVDFPEYVVMDPYLHKLKKNTCPIYTDELHSTNEDPDIESWHSEALNFSKHVYRLKAVIVHRGSHNDGHFMTYRRGTATSQLQHRCSDSRWYLVSDTEVKETTLYNVLTSVAYVLFYEKCSELL